MHGTHFRFLLVSLHALDVVQLIVKEWRGPSNSLTCDGLDYQAREMQGRETFICMLIRLRSSAYGNAAAGGANSPKKIFNIDPAINISNRSSCISKISIIVAETGFLFWVRACFLYMSMSRTVRLVRVALTRCQL